MKRAGLLAAAAVVALTAACAVLQPPPDEAREVAATLAKYERVAALPAEEQRREFAAAQAAYEQTPTDATRLDLALALLLPRAPWRDDARAQTLLANVEAAPGGRHSARRDLAQVVLKLVGERQAAQRDEQRKVDQLLHQLREERQKTEEMQKKIESLRAIDRELRPRRKAP